MAITRIVLEMIFDMVSRLSGQGAAGKVSSLCIVHEYDCH
jgi:hypothetical protein